MLDFKKNTKKTSNYKTIYIKDSILEELENIALVNDVSFNKVVVTILEDYLSKTKEIE